ITPKTIKTYSQKTPTTEQKPDEYMSFYTSSSHAKGITIKDLDEPMANDELAFPIYTSTSKTKSERKRQKLADEDEILHAPAKKQLFEAKTVIFVLIFFMRNISTLRMT